MFDQTPQPPYPPQRYEPTRMMEMVRAQTDVTSLLAVVADCYRLRTTAERDILNIQTQYDHARQSAAEQHEEIMLALQGEYAERSQQLAMIDRAAQAFIAMGEFPLAQAIISQVLEVQKTSVLGSAMQARRDSNRGTI